MASYVRGTRCPGGQNGAPSKEISVGGLYNGFLAAGLAYGLVADDRAFTVFFLLCVIVAGLYGAATVSRRILLVQALPAAPALAAVLLAG